MPEELKLHGLQTFLTDSERNAFNRIRKKKGLTSKGALRNAILDYICKESADERITTNG